MRPCKHGIQVVACCKSCELLAKQLQRLSCKLLRLL